MMLSAHLRHAGRRVVMRRGLVTTSHRAASSSGYWVTAGALTVIAASVALVEPELAALDAPRYGPRRIPTSGDVLMLGPTKEKATGILFPQLCNGYTLVGCGVRVKYGFVKVYAVGTYVDPTAMMAVKSQSKDIIEKALLNPMYPRTIRIVMNRGLSINKYTAAIVEALEPRMKGEDLFALEEFKKLNPPVDLVEGAEMEMTIRGDTLLYRNASGGVGAIHSAVFTEALCDVYYGNDPVSPTHKDAVVDGIAKL